MQAAIFHGERRITIGEVPQPEPAPGEVLLKVSRTALCGSDTKLWIKGATFTPGHEIFGTVASPGHALSGRRCLVYIPVHCGHCASCAAGETHMCLTIAALVGWNRPGGYAEYLAVPEQCLLPVPDDIDDTLAPLLLDTIGTASHAARFVARLAPADDPRPVLITGAGPVGLGALLSMQAMGYRNIHVSDPRPERLALARSFGAIEHPVGDASQRFRLIVECSGAHAARDLGTRIAAPHGVLALVGENETPWPFTETPAYRRKDFYMVRTFYFPKADFDRNLAFLRERREAFRTLVDAQFGPAALPEMFGRFVAGELVKPLLSFA